jgi:hypothetical protein
MNADKVYICGNCESEHCTLSSAIDCCAKIREEYQCRSCLQNYETFGQANACCTPDDDEQED